MKNKSASQSAFFFKLMRRYKANRI